MKTERTPLDIGRICDSLSGPTATAASWDTGFLFSQLSEAPQLVAGGHGPQERFCSFCGSSRLSYGQPEGDTNSRLSCAACGRVFYRNPRVVVGCMVRQHGAILLSRRAIVPRIGYWTVPAGFLEEGESTEEGARRELHEEARVRVDSARLAAVYEIPQVNQINFIYVADVDHCAPAPGAESSEVRLWHAHELHLSDLAFPTDHRLVHLSQQSQSPLGALEFGRISWSQDGRVLLTHLSQA